MKPQRGDIFWVKNVPSKTGWDYKNRPVLITSVQGNSITALAITTKFARPPKSNEIIIHEDGTTDDTGLKQPCAVNLDWRLELKLEDMDGKSGFLDKGTMNVILEQV